ncbi:MULTISPECIES: AraC family transcriptional regulator [Lactobacillus]|uniref:AraC family transcriptional regulator n=1 Tax=Lactobacillus xujianguonis TaxID=2495899 RepID=A0A437SW18_9LACO|nr:MULTISPECIES: AraC family transcriptional regulator [Lactobacillus]RVU71082.1 AraC family transcriptional regulator [Lactobacillus xujianguonis]RVU76762.1 AraC family transcriptional regulator [Lactobacillus xujianguonis]
MAAVALDQYLMSVIRSSSTSENEIRLKAGNSGFDLFTIYLENHNSGIHRYQMDVSTILYVVSGTVTIKSGEKNIEMKTGNVLLLTENSHYEVVQDEDAVLVKIKFLPGFKYREFFKDFAYKGSKEESIIVQIIDSLETEHVLWLKNNQVMCASQVMEHIVDGYLNDDLFTRALIGAELTVVMILSIRNQRMVTLPTLDKTKFDSMVLDSYIDAHFTDITLKEAAKYFGFNPNYFSNMVKQKTGKSFVDHVDERRMQEARELLAHPNISLKEIIARVGYSSKSFFYKKFNQFYGETPAAMRSRLFKEANINLH